MQYCQSILESLCMTIFPHDEFAKGVLETLLSPFGKVDPSYKIAAGVYLLASAQKTGIIVIHRLPKTPETLWFRILGKDGVQKRAIEEVNELPKGHPYRQNTLELLGNLKVTLESQTNIQLEDRDLIMQLSPLYLEKIQAAEQKGKLEGEQQKQQEIAVKMMQKNISLETIAELTELSIEQLQSLRLQLESN
jgi:predicted transposase/invertase (TIGR01784 family)